MAKVKLSSAPGCIGSPLIRAEDHPLCKTCSFTNVCKKLSVVNAQRLQESFGIAALSKDTGKKLLKGAEKMTIAQLEAPKYGNVKPLHEGSRPLFNSLSKLGLETIQSLLTSSRRIEVEHGLQSIKTDWAREILLLFWDNDLSVNKKDLRDFLSHDLGYDRMSAVNSVSRFINATTNLGLFKETKQKLEMIRE